MLTETQTPSQFIKSLEIYRPKTEHNINPKGHAFKSVDHESAVEGKDESYINNQSIVSFVANVSEQNRQDVLHSTLIAQLAAEKKYPKNSDTIKWFEEYRNVLSRIGWDLSGKDFSNYYTDKTIIEVEAVIFELFGSAIGSQIKTILKNTLAAIKGLADANNSKIIAFENNTHTVERGSFQIAAIDETGGVASINIGCFLLTNAHQIKQILFFRSTKDTFKLETSSAKGTLTSSVYATVREEIINKLGDVAKESIYKIEI